MNVENATRNTNETYFNITVTYTSWVGYQFSDKTKMKQVTCTENGTWYPDYPGPCEGKIYTEYPGSCEGKNMDWLRLSLWK